MMKYEIALFLFSASKNDMNQTAHKPTWYISLCYHAVMMIVN